MKKNHNPNDIPQREGHDQCKKLYRSVTEQAKHLDDARSCAQKVGDLFTPKLHIQRRKFREYCERLVFSDPVLFGHKGEELLWRKSYYDVISTAKRLKKREYSQEEICNIEAHINSGVGYYHHYVAKLQLEYELDLNGFVDFTLYLRKDRVKDRKKAESEDLKKWASESVHRCLIYLGDLCRYKLDIYPNWDWSLAIRYYSQALYLNSDYGMPHNQMGTLASAQNRTLDAVYHYMHCLACKVSFEGTENNLQRLFEKNSQFLEKLPSNTTENSDNVIQIDKADHIKQMLARFFLLIDVWYFDKSVPHIYNLCHQTYIDLEECLSYYKPVSSESGDTELDSVETDASANLSYLTSDSLFKIVIICLLCISKLQKRHSCHLSTVVAFTLAVYSQLVQNVITHLQQAVLSFPLPDPVLENNISNSVNVSQKREKKKKIALRRRRKSLGGSDSEMSEEENPVEIESSDESLVSDDDVQLASSSDEELENDKKSDESEQRVENTERNEKDDPSKKIDDAKNMMEIIKKSRAMEAADVLEIISEEGFLQSIKIVNDWLMCEEEVLKSCSKSSRSLLRQITHLLNFLNVDFGVLKMKGVDRDVKNLRENLSSIGLSEDVLLKGIDVLSEAQKDIAWNNVHKSNMSAKEECVARVMKIVAFGNYLTKVKEAGVEYDAEKAVFSCESDSNEEKVPTITFEELEKQNGEVILNKSDMKEFESKNGQLIKMKHMGQLWLAAEVRALESRVKGKASYSPYLVLDADALIKQTFMVKHLVNSRKFIIIVPSAVVSALDDLKREKQEARDAIRWLESQFHQGNRFFRAQRPHERAPLPFIKYPKKKDKAAFIYIQIIECCHYLAQQQKGASNLVTLLIGNQNILTNGENKEISYIGLAKSAGVQIELITQFYSKWKKAARGKR